MSQRFILSRAIAISILHAISMFGLYILIRDHCNQLILTHLGLFYFFCNTSITVGSHRLWSHRSFKAKLPFRIWLMIWTSITNQGTIYHWARDHIVHHKYSDTTADPHNINNGFFFAHVGWLLYEKHSDVIQAGKAINDKYLLDDPVVTFQKQNAWWWMPLWCYLFPTMYGIVFLHMPAVDAFCILAVLRWVLSMHATWCVNSVAHTFGYKPYDTDMKPTENTFTNIVAVGEGSHNWHHKYPNDYAASEYDMLTTGKVFNPSKCIIDLMYCCGQVYDLKRFDYVNKKWLLFN